MISTLYTFTLSLSLTFMFLDHPLSMGLILLTQTTLITGLMSHNLWFSYILFMIMIGGMLLLFIYMTSVASNEKFSFSNNLFTLMAWTTISATILPMTDQFFPYQNTTNMDIYSTQNNVMYTLSMSMYLNFSLNSWMITLIIYLLMALIAVVKITTITYGPLRQKM